jgi:DNA-binding GntR family transcriptional regulator
MQQDLLSSADASADALPLLPRLRRLVTSGTFAPGELMPEMALALEFGVSRTPVREALKQLENEGLVRIQPRVGTFVRTPTTREIVELFQVKESLEGLAAGLLARRGATPETAELQRNIEESEAAVAAGDAPEYARLIHDFHWAIVNGSDNTKLREHYERLMNQLAYHRIVLRTLDQPGRMRASNEEHRAVVKAILSKDAVGAEFAMRSHVDASSRAALGPSTDPRPLNRPTPHSQEANE